MADFSPLVFQDPTHIAYEDTLGWIWGDEESGKVRDWYYISSPTLSQVIFGLPLGGFMKHSDENKTIYPSDIFYYILEGNLVLANPENGEIHKAREGDAVFFRRDTWHHAFNYGTTPLRILEFAAPPALEAIEYAKSKPNLSKIRYTNMAVLDAWPERVEEVRRSRTMWVITEAQSLWQLWGDGTQTLVGILASTTNLTVGQLELLPGRRTDVEARDAEMSFFVARGRVNIEVPESGHGARSFDLNPWDGFYLPRNTPYRVANFEGDPASVLFQIVPGVSEG